jgi:hypothetical protein
MAQTSIQFFGLWSNYLLLSYGFCTLWHKIFTLVRMSPQLIMSRTIQGLVRPQKQFLYYPNWKREMKINHGKH